MNSLKDTFTLHNGVKIPCVGFGTWQAEEGKEAVKAVRDALEAGYRHIDTAAAYRNEASVGKALKESGLSRQEVFVTSKLPNSVRGYDQTKKSFARTLENLGFDYLDLYLVHWPKPLVFRDHWQKANADSWRAIEELYEAGAIKSIGVSNFLPSHLDELAKTANVQPMVNQIKLCPGITQPEVTEYCQSQQILLEAYSPLGTGDIFTDPDMQKLAEKYQRTIAQVSLRWSLQMGFLPLPKSVNTGRIKENAALFDFTLDEDDVKIISELKNCCGSAPDSDNMPF